MYYKVKQGQKKTTCTRIDDCVHATFELETLVKIKKNNKQTRACM